MELQKRTENHLILKQIDYVVYYKKVKHKKLLPKQENLFYIGLRQVPLSNIRETLKRKYPNPQGQTVQLRADENVPYETVRKIMQEIAAAGITRINFSTRIESFAEDPQVKGSRVD